MEVVRGSNVYLGLTTQADQRHVERSFHLQSYIEAHIVLKTAHTTQVPVARLVAVAGAADMAGTGTFHPQWSIEQHMADLLTFVTDENLSNVVADDSSQYYSALMA